MDYIYGIGFNQVLMTILIGVSISMLLYERKGILSGGLIVPAIMSLFMTKIIYVLSTLLLAIILHFIIVYLRKHVILYGRRLYSLVLVMGIGLVLLSRSIAEFIHYFGFGLNLTESGGILSLPFIELSISQQIINLGFGMHYYGYVIGLLIVPIIVNDTQTQGLRKTLIALMGVSLITFILVAGILLLESIILV